MNLNLSSAKLKCTRKKNNLNPEDSESQLSQDPSVFRKRQKICDSQYENPAILFEDNAATTLSSNIENSTISEEFSGKGFLDINSSSLDGSSSSTESSSSSTAASDSSTVSCSSTNRSLSPFIEDNFVTNYWLNSDNEHDHNYSRKLQERLALEAAIFGKPKNVPVSNKISLEGSTITIIESVGNGMRNDTVIAGNISDGNDNLLNSKNTQTDLIEYIL